MAASTKRFTLTNSAYQDVSEGASEIWFLIPFERNQVNDVRLVIAQSLPSSGTSNYFRVSPNYNPVGPNDLPQDFTVSIARLSASDRVYLLTDTNITLPLTVFRI